jgi:hypothetical protein
MYPYKLTRLICYASVAFIAFLLLVIFIASPAQADVFVFGSLDNYTPIVLPNNSYVHQGENISQGNYYDLTGVYGFSGTVANWNDEDNEGITYPDHVVFLSKPRTVYIDPAIFPVGRWHQFDGGVNTTGGYSFGSDNTYVFKVVANPNGMATGESHTVTKTSYITILQNGESVQVPVTYTEIETVTPAILATATQPTETATAQETAAPVDQPPAGDAQDVNGYGINGPVVGAVQVTASAPVPVWVPVFAVIGMLIVRRWKR